MDSRSKKSKRFVTLMTILLIFTGLCAGARRRFKTESESESRNDNIRNARRRSHRSNNSPLENMEYDEEELDPEEILNISNNDEEVEALRRSQIDPKGSWLTFVRYSNDRESDGKPDRRKKKRNKKNRNKMLHGPPGPAGPPGPPGPSVSKEEILEELKLLIKEATEKRVNELLSTINYSNVTKESIVKPEVTNDLYTVPRVYSGFSMRLSEKTVIRKYTFTELKDFQQAFGDGSFQRGDAFNAKEGRFIAPRAGIYQFSANLHLRMRWKKKPKGRSKMDDHIKVLICLDSLCQSNTSIEHISGLNADSRIFTISVSGILQLKVNQYASVYVDNSSSKSMTVLTGSEFSGLLLGS